MEYENLSKILETEELLEYRSWISKIPFINFPKKWNVKIIPPFGGALVRFLINTNNHKSKKHDCLSVYLDCYENLGFFGEPYWEIYPDKDGENNRYTLDNIDGLLEGIKLSLRKNKL